MSSSTPPSEAPNVIKSGFSAIKWLFILQLGSRFITFGLNTAIARTVSHSTFAIANLQLQLLLNIILPLSREAFRRAILRAPLDASSRNYKLEAQKLLLFSWLSVPIGFVMSLLVTFIFLWSSSTEELGTVGYVETISLVGLSTFVEMLSEPLYILAQHRLMFGTRAAVELLSVAAKSVCAFIFVVYLGLGLPSFGMVQVIYSAGVSLGYWFYFGFISPLPEFPSVSKLLPGRVVVDSDKGPKVLSWRESLDGSLFGYLTTFEWQTVQKMVLQEGEKFLLRGAESLANQGIFALVNVLGSLVVRFVFAWLEEGLFPLFSKLLVQAQSMDPKDSARSTLLRKAGAILSILVKLMFYIGLVFATFGPNYSFLLLDLLYTSKYSNTTAPIFLAWYCVYILVMGVNGTTEAFAHSAASSSTLNFFNILMVCQSLLFVALSLFFLNIDYPAGIIMANCCVGLTRIIFSVSFIQRFFNSNLASGENSFSVARIIPHPLVLILFGVSFAVTRISESSLCAHTMQIVPCAMHVASGVVCLAFIGLAVLVFERRFIKDMYYFLRHRDVSL